MEMYSFKNDVYLVGSPIFAQNFNHGSKKKLKGFILDFVLYFNGGSCFCDCGALALVNPDFAFCDYFFCTGNGYHLK